jgi:hypothetical protein
MRPAPTRLVGGRDGRAARLCSLRRRLARRLDGALIALTGRWFPRQNLSVSCGTVVTSCCPAGAAGGAVSLPYLVWSNLRHAVLVLT